jgi:hypothetical protein
LTSGSTAWARKWDSLLGPDDALYEDSRPEVGLKILPGGIGLRLSLMSSKNRERKGVSDFQPMKRGIDEWLWERTNE